MIATAILLAIIAACLLQAGRHAGGRRRHSYAARHIRRYAAHAMRHHGRL